MANITTVPSGWVYSDASVTEGSGHILTSGKTIPAPGNGDYLQHRSSSSTSTWDMQYKFYSSTTLGNKTYTNVWVLQLGLDKAITGTLSIPSYTSLRSTSYKVVGAYVSDASYAKMTSVTNIPSGYEYLNFSSATSLTSIGTLPSSLLSFNAKGCTALTSIPTLNNGLKELWIQGCTKITSVPTVPSTVTDLTSAFRGCTALTGVIAYNGTPTDLNNAFLDTTKDITLVGTSQSLQVLANTANNNNVYVGFKVSVNSLTSIRCNAEGVQYEEGDYGLLTVGWTAHTGTNVYANRVIVKANGVELTNVTWYSDRALTQPITFPEVLASSGTKYALLPTDDSAKGISVEVETSYSTYTWLSPIIYTTLTGKAFILDISRDGKSFALFASANDDVTDNELIIGVTGMPINIRIAGTPLELLPYPVGACFIGNSNLDPSDLFGGTWSIVSGVSVGTNNTMWRRTA